MMKTYRLKQKFTVSKYEPGDDLTGVAIPDDMIVTAGVIVEIIDPEEWQLPRWWTTTEEFEAKMEACDEPTTH